MDAGPAALARLARALANLPALQREVYLAASADGLGYPAIATKLDISEAEVERLLAAALVALDRATG